MGKHRWSGWPGAFCLDCGQEDALEAAVALEWLDPFTDQWDSEEHRQLVIRLMNNCPVEREEKDA